VVTHINLIQSWFEELKAKVPTTPQDVTQQRPEARERQGDGDTLVPLSHQTY